MKSRRNWGVAISDIESLSIRARLPRRPSGEKGFGTPRNDSLCLVYPRNSAIASMKSPIERKIRELRVEPARIARNIWIEPPLPEPLLEMQGLRSLPFYSPLPIPFPYIVRGFLNNILGSNLCSGLSGHLCSHHKCKQARQ